MKDPTLFKEFCDQITAIKRYSFKRSKHLKPGRLHRLRSAILRLGIFIKYGLSEDDIDLYWGLMKCRRAIALRRDCDVCLVRIKNDMDRIKLSSRFQRRIIRSLNLKIKEEDRKLERLFKSKRYRKLIAKAERSVGHLKGFDLPGIRKECALPRKTDHWKPGRFHQIRKRVRILKYVQDVLNNDKTTAIDQDQGLKFAKCQKILGDYIDGRNTIRILKGLNIKKSGMIKQLVDQERGKIKGAQYLINSSST